VVPFGALTRFGYWATYWAVWSTMIWLDTKVAPLKCPTTTTGMFGLEELGRVPGVHHVRPGPLDPEGDEVDPVAGRDGGPTRAPPPLRAGRSSSPRVALLWATAWSDRLEVVERLPRPFDHQEGERAPPGRRRPPRAPPRAGRRRSGPGRAAGTGPPGPGPAVGGLGAEARDRRSAGTRPPTSTSPSPWGASTRATVRTSRAARTLEAAAAPPQRHGVAGQDGEGDAVAGVDVIHPSPSDWRWRRAMSNSAALEPVGEHLDAVADHQHPGEDQGEGDEPEQQGPGHDPVDGGREVGVQDGGPWWSVRHQSTEKWTMGTSTRRTGRRWRSAGPGRRDRPEPGAGPDSRAGGRAAARSR
jgi:hypothetical protein